MRAGPYRRSELRTLGLHFQLYQNIKNHGDRVLPDRQVVTMDKPFLSAYSRLLIKTCHKRGAFAMGNGGVYPQQRCRP